MTIANKNDDVPSYVSQRELPPRIGLMEQCMEEAAVVADLFWVSAGNTVDGCKITS